MARSDRKFSDHFERMREAKKEALQSLPGEDEAPLPPPVDPIRNSSGGPERNDPCPCGSRKKYKQCCMKKK